MRLLLLFVFLITLFTQVSCKKYVAADEAFFIKPGTIKVATTASQGSGSHKITDLWVYVNGKFQGSYPIEGSIPIISKGQQVSINVFAGILDNGIKSTRIFSPFYDLISFDTLVPGGATITRPFTFTYRSATTFTWVEGFEGIANTTSNKGDTASYIVADGNGFEGRYLKLTGSNTATLLEVQSLDPGFNLPLGNSNVYLELNYKCNYTVIIGVLTTNGEPKEAFYINPQTDWNKIYISLAAAVNQNPVTTKQKVYIRMLKTGTDAPQLCLDNIKLVYL